MKQHKIVATESRVRRLFQRVRCAIFSLEMHGEFVRGAVFTAQLRGKTYYGKLAFPDRMIPVDIDDQMQLVASQLNKMYSPCKRSLDTPNI